LPVNLEIIMAAELFILSAIMSIGALVGIGVWENPRTESFEFYFGVTISCLIISSIVGIIHTFDIEMPLEKVILLHFITIPCLGMIYILLWLTSTLMISRNLVECVDNPAFKCNGEIVTTIFGLFNLITWFVIVVVGCKSWYRMYLMHKHSYNTPI